MKHAEYLLIMWNREGSHLVGPFESEDDRDIYAGRIRLHHGTSHGIYQVTMQVPEKEKETGDLTVKDYDNEELEKLAALVLDKEARFYNCYQCPRCNFLWSNSWESQPDDDCPNCGHRHVSPYLSEELK